MTARSLEDYCSAAHDLIQRGQCKEAIAICRRVLLRYPLHVRSYVVLGEACLAMGEHAEAANLFRRVLGADPENAIAYAGLGVIYEERELLEEATWQMERAFELTPYNTGVRETLSALYAQLDTVPRRRLKLTRAALARCYARGRLYPKAIGEFHAILQDEPDRLDLRVSLAEALWHNEQYEMADAVCRGILELAPNCLKANLIMGEICLRDREREEQGRAYLQRAQRLDPENLVAQAIFGERSPLPPRIVPLAPREKPKEEPAPLPEELLPGEKLATVEELLHLDEARAPTTAEGVTEAAAEEAEMGIESAVPEAEPTPPPATDLLPPLEETAEPPILIAKVPPVSVVEELRISEEEPLTVAKELAEGEREAESTPLIERVPAEKVRGEVEILPEAESLAVSEIPSAEIGLSETPGIEKIPITPTGEAPRKVRKKKKRGRRRRKRVYAAYLARIKEDPKDYLARLELARTYHQDEQIEEALTQYAELIRARSGPDLLEEAIMDLQALVESSPGHRKARELLGDAYLKANRFSEALESYRMLLETLEQEGQARPESENS